MLVKWVDFPYIFRNFATQFPKMLVFCSRAKGHAFVLVSKSNKKTPPNCKKRPKHFQGYRYCGPWFSLQTLLFCTALFLTGMIKKDDHSLKQKIVDLFAFFEVQSLSMCLSAGRFISSSRASLVLSLKMQTSVTSEI